MEEKKDYSWLQFYDSPTYNKIVDEMNEEELKEFKETCPDEYLAYLVFKNTNWETFEVKMTKDINDFLKESHESEKPKTR